MKERTLWIGTFYRPDKIMGTVKRGGWNLCTKKQYSTAIYQFYCGTNARRRYGGLRNASDGSTRVGGDALFALVCWRRGTGFHIVPRSTLHVWALSSSRYPVLTGAPLQPFPRISRWVLGRWAQSHLLNWVLSCTDWVKKKCVRMRTHFHILCIFFSKVSHVRVRSVDGAPMRTQK